MTMHHDTSSTAGASAEQMTPRPDIDGIEARARVAPVDFLDRISISWRGGTRSESRAYYEHIAGLDPPTALALCTYVRERDALAERYAAALRAILDELDNVVAIDRIVRVVLGADR